MSDPDARPTAHVFISHCAADAARAVRLCAALEAAGCRCWMAPRDIQPAASWPEAIAAAVKGSRALAVLVSRHSTESSHLVREVELAVADRVPVIPVRLDDAPLSPGLQYLLSSVQWIDASRDPPDRQAETIRAALEGRIVEPPPPVPGRLGRGIVATLAGLAAVAGIVLARRPTTPVAPPPVALPAEAASLPFADLLRTVWAGTPPTAGPTRPALAIEILAARHGTGELVALEDGDSLRSAVDLYTFRARPATPGHLYVFQIDSRGSIFWLFPRNDTCDVSTGANPVAPGRIEIPGDGRGFSLDEVAGPEHVCVVFSNARWPELEAQLAAAARADAGGTPLAGTRTPRTRGVASARPLPAGSAATIRLGDRDLAPPAVSALLHQAGGSTLVIDRWFRHE